MRGLEGTPGDRSSSAPGLVIFDSDGVLVDSEPIANRILAEALTAAGHPCTFPQSVERFVGHGLDSVMEMVEDELGRPLPDGFAERVQEATFAACRAELAPVSGVAEGLAEIDAPICVASSGRIEKLHLTLGVTGLRAFFADNLFSATMVARGKPHPDLFLHAAEQMGVAPGSSVVVEDSLPGVAGARAAGMRVLGYAGGSHVAPDYGARLAAAGAETFAEMAALPALLGSAGRITPLR